MLNHLKKKVKKDREEKEEDFLNQKIVTERKSVVIEGRLINFQA
tara:strand:+ start:56 stop:187 length:132 start_codon:yes stop_codon:yes gene_type:complete